MKHVITGAALLVLLAAPPARAQQLSLQIADGRVTLDAVNVPAREILAEWARVGGTTVVGADKIVGPPLTLKLNEVPEREALDIILRNVAGFMAAPRQAAAANASVYDRILIMATSSTPPPPPPSRTGAGVRLPDGTERRVPPRPPDFPSMGDPPDDRPVIFDDQGNPVDPADTGAPPVFAFPNPPDVPPSAPNQPVFVPVPNADPSFGQGVPVLSLQPGQNGPTIYNFVPDMTRPAPGTVPAPPGTPPTAGFTIMGAPSPGMIQAPQPVPGQPGQVAPGQPQPVPPRPPGR